MEGPERNSAAPHVHLSARERVSLLFDLGQPIVELGSQATALAPDVDAPRDGVVVALGAIHGRTTVVVCYDGSVADGTHGVVSHLKVERALTVARHLEAPLVQIMEGGGYRPSEPPYFTERRDLTRQLVSLSGRVPLVGIVLGPVTDLRALQLGISDVVIATGCASISLDEPQRPGHAEHVPAETAPLELCGAIDVPAADDRDALSIARRYLHFFSTPIVPFLTTDESDVADALRRVVPDNPRRAIDGRRLTDLVVDAGTALRVRERFGGSLQTSLGRVGGRAVGLIATHSMVGAGTIDSPAADKFAHFVHICDTFGLPIIYLTDVPGLLAGPAAEHMGINRHATRPYFAQVHSRVPQLTVQVRRAYGQGMILMGMGDHVEGKVLQLTWPSAQFGGMGLEGAATITATSSATTRGGEGPSQTQLYEELVAHGTARRLAERFDTDEVIDPGETRDRLIAAVQLLPVIGTRKPPQPLDPW